MYRKLVFIHRSSDGKEGPLCIKLTPACSRLLFSRCGKFSEHGVPNYCRASLLPAGAGARSAALLRGNLRGISENGGGVINSHFLENMPAGLGSRAGITKLHLCKISGFKRRRNRLPLDFKGSHSGKTDFSALASFRVAVQSMKDDNLRSRVGLVDLERLRVTTFPH